MLLFLLYFGSNKWEEETYLKTLQILLFPNIWLVVYTTVLYYGIQIFNVLKEISYTHQFVYQKHSNFLIFLKYYCNLKHLFSLFIIQFLNLNSFLWNKAELSES